MVEKLFNMKFQFIIFKTSKKISKDKIELFK